MATKFLFRVVKSTPIGTIVANLLASSKECIPAQPAITFAASDGTLGHLVLNTRQPPGENRDDEDHGDNDAPDSFNTMERLTNPSRDMLYTPTAK